MGASGGEVVVDAVEHIERHARANLCEDCSQGLYSGARRDGHWRTREEDRAVIEARPASLRGLDDLHDGHAGRGLTAKDRMRYWVRTAPSI